MEVVFLPQTGQPVGVNGRQFDSYNSDEKIVADAPEVALWRLSYDLDLEEVVVKFEGMTDAEAEAAQDAAIQEELEAAQAEVSAGASEE